MQNKPNFRKTKMNTNSILTKHYENKSNWKLGENKPNTNPIRTQTNPTCRGVASGEAGSIQANNNAQNFFAGSNLLFFPLTWPKLIPI